MRPWSASSEAAAPRPPERGAGRPGPRAAAARALALLLSAALLAAAGCVTRGTHREVVAERDRLAAEVEELRDRVRLLEASKESLSDERVELIDTLEDLRQARADLEQRVEELEATRAELSQSLDSRSRELGRMRETYDALVQDLESEVTAGRIQIEQLRDGIRLNLPQAILFPSGSARLDAEGREVLAKVAGRLEGREHRVEVQGHTDDVPIRGALAERYPTNWELAAARAARVVRLLASRGVETKRLAAVSYGEERPVASNQTPEGRARNRRIEIRLLPREGTARGAGAGAEGAGSAGEAAPEAGGTQPGAGAAPTAEESRAEESSADGGA